MDLFISYSRRDKAFVERLRAWAEANGLEVWIDTADIPPAARWREEIIQAIEETLDFVLVVSPDSLGSKNVLQEVEHAASLHKPMIPLILKPVDRTWIPQAVREFQFIDFTSAPEEAAFDQLLRAARKDDGWKRTHAWLLQRAAAWDRGEGAYLQDQDLERAEAWMARTKAEGREGSALEDQFIRASQRQARIERESKADTLSNRVLAGFPEDPELGILLARAAIETYAATPRAVRALWEALAASRLRARLVVETPDDLRSAVFSPDGAEIAAGYYDGTLQLWPRDLSRPRLELRPDQPAQINALGFSSDGARLAAGSEFGRLWVWEVGDGKLVHDLDSGSRWIRAVAFSRDDALIIVLDEDGSIQLLDAGRGTPLAKLKSGLRNQGKGIAASLSRDGQWLVLGAEDGKIELWRLERESTGGEQRMKRFQCFKADEEASSVDVAPDGRLVVSAWDFSEARLWESSSGERLRVFGQAASLENRVLTVRFDPEGRRVATGHGQGVVRLWEAESGREELALQGDSDEGMVHQVDFDPEGGSLLSCTTASLQIWSLRPAIERSQLELEGAGDGVTTGAFLPDDSALLIGTIFSGLKVWNWRTGRVLRQHDVGGRVHALEVAPDGARFVCASDSAVTIRSLETLEDLLTLTGHEGIVAAASFSKDGRRVLTGSPEDGSARVWDAATGEQLAQLSGYCFGCRAFQFSPDGARILTANGEAPLQLWDAASGEEVLRIEGEAGVWSEYFADLDRALEAAVFTSDGKRIISGSRIGTIRFWEAQTGAHLKQVIGPGDEIYSLALSADGAQFATGYGEGAIAFWDTLSGELLAQIDYEPGAWALAYAHQGEHLFSAGLGPATVWPVPSAERLLSLSAGRVFRALTVGERRQYGLPDPGNSEKP